MKVYCALLHGFPNFRAKIQQSFHSCKYFIKYFHFFAKMLIINYQLSILFAYSVFLLYLCTRFGHNTNKMTK